MKPIHRVVVLAACCAVVLTACSQAEQPVAEPAQAASATANVSDADTTTHVKSALNKVPDLRGANITVVTTKGDVRLTGAVASQAQIEAIISAARGAEGVHSIHNELTIQK